MTQGDGALPSNCLNRPTLLAFRVGPGCLARATVVVKFSSDRSGERRKIFAGGLPGDFGVRLSSEEEEAVEEDPPSPARPKGTSPLSVGCC